MNAKYESILSLDSLANDGANFFHPPNNNNNTNTTNPAADSGINSNSNAAIVNISSSRKSKLRKALTSCRYQNTQKRFKVDGNFIPAMLCEQTYRFRDKMLTFGLDVDSFQPVFYFCGVKNAKIRLSLENFDELFSNPLSGINNGYHQFRLEDSLRIDDDAIECKRVHFRSNQLLKIRIFKNKKNEKYLILENIMTNVRIIFDQTDLDCLRLMRELIISLKYYLFKIKKSVKHFYEWYLTSCKALNVLELDFDNLQDFQESQEQSSSSSPTTINQDHDFKIDYSKLFLEIRAFLTQSYIKTALQMNKL